MACQTNATSHFDGQHTSADVTILYVGQSMVCKRGQSSSPSGHHKGLGADLVERLDDRVDDGRHGVFLGGVLVLLPHASLEVYAEL